MEIDSRTLQMSTAENGSPTAIFQLSDGRRIFLHSRFDPEAEACFLIEKIPIREQTLYVVLGFGLGYHVKELLGRIPSNSHVLVMEPATEQLSTHLLDYYRKKGEAWIQDDRLSFHSHYDPETVPMFLADAFIRHRALSLSIFMHIPSASTNEAFYRGLLKEIQEKFPVYLEGHIDANDIVLENNLSNFWANLPVTWQTPHISHLKRRWEQYPAVIVAAGPSLTKELERLRQAQGKVLIVSVGTSAGILMKHGVRPDFVVSVDPFEANMSHFRNWDNSSVSLIYYHRIWRGIPPMYNGPKYWFTMDDEPPIPLSGIQGSNEFWRGGTVAFTALQVAHYLKADPIILAGMDFALLDGRTHAEDAAHSGVLDEEITLSERFFRIPGVSGDQVVTHIVYYSYLLYIQDYIQRHPQTRHINTSSTGAKIHGTIEKSLEDTLQEYSVEEKNSGERLVCEIHKTHQSVSVSWDRILDTVSQWEQELSDFVDDNEAINHLDKLISSFRRLLIYMETPHAYDDCFHTWEIRKIKNKPGFEETLCTRLKEHCRFVLNQIREFLDDRKKAAQMR